MPTERDKIEAWLKKVIPSQTQGQPDQWAGRGMIFTGGPKGRVKPSDVGGAVGALGMADAEVPEVGMEAVSKLAKAGVEAKKKYDVFKGVPHNSPVRALMNDIQQLWGVFGKLQEQIRSKPISGREKTLAFAALDNFIQNPLQKAQAMALSHASEGAAGTGMVRAAGKASLDDIKAAHEQIKSLLEGGNDILKEGGTPVQPPKRTGSVTEFLQDRMRAEAEQPKQAPIAQQSLPEAPKAVSEPQGPVQAKTAPGAPKAPQRVPQPKDPEMYVSNLVEVGGSPSMRLDPKTTMRLQMRLQDIIDNPDLQVVSDETELLKKVLANQGQK